MNESVGDCPQVTHGIWLLVCAVLLGGLWGRGTAEDVKPYEEAFNVIAYSAVSGIGDAPINSAEHFLHCASPDYPFTSLKGDIRITADDGLIMCHDAGFTLDDEGRITSFDSENMTAIRDMTFEACKALQYAREYNGKAAQVCDFETYLRICAEHGKDAFITIRSEYIDEVIRAMIPVIYEYQMQTRCMINSFTYKSLEQVHAYDASLRLSWVLNKGSFTRSAVDKAHELETCCITLFNFPAATNGGINRITARKKEILYAQRKGVALYAALVESISYVDTLREAGISGAQICSLNETTPEAIEWPDMKLTGESEINRR